MQTVVSVTIDKFYSNVILSFQAFSLNRIIQYMVFYVWLQWFIKDSFPIESRQ